MSRLTPLAQASIAAALIASLAATSVAAAGQRISLARGDSLEVTCPTRLAYTQQQGTLHITCSSSDNQQVEGGDRPDEGSDDEGGDDKHAPGRHRPQTSTSSTGHSTDTSTHTSKGGDDCRAHPNHRGC
jgi:hypothetical protein